MSQSWPVVALGEVIEHRKEFIEIQDAEQYKRCRVQLHAKGIVLRDVVSGADIRTKRQQVCRTGEFLVAEIDAKLGGFGIVPEELEDAIVSSHYFVFTVNETKLERSFLDYYIRTAIFQDQVTAQGSTNYAAIRPQHVLEYTIPLPPLDEQRRIVAQIEALAGRVAEAQRLRAEALAEVEAVSRAILFSEDGWQATPTRMCELVNLRPTDVAVEAEQVYEFAGVYSFGRGVFRSQSKTGAEFAYKRLSTLRTGNFVYPKLMAWEGALGVVPPECDGCVVSPEFPVFEINRERVLPEVLDTYFKTKAVWPSLAGNSTGTNVRRRRLHPDEFLAYLFPLPPMQVQLKLKEIKDKLRPVTDLQRQTQAKLYALLPAILDKAFQGKL